MVDGEQDERPTVIERRGPAEWTFDTRCQQCGFPWRFYGVTETSAVDIHQTVKCPNCGCEYTFDLHHE